MMQEFAVELGQFADDVTDGVVDLHREVVLFIFAAIVQRSPVDTGVYRGNHRVSVGTIDTAMGPDPKASNLPSAGELLADATRAANDALTSLAPFTTVYIQNNLPYAEPLEEGHSQQAPLGIYKLALADAEQEYTT